MHEQAPSESDNRQQLIELLSIDFTPPEHFSPENKRELEREAEEGNALAGFLSRAVPIQPIGPRFASEENEELGRKAEELLEPAPITASFKGYIVHALRHAHAWQSQLDRPARPDSLGLTAGQGIFDSDKARELEAEALRNYWAGHIEQPPVMPFDIDPRRRVEHWLAEYWEAYREDPFANMRHAAGTAPEKQLVEAGEDFREVIRRALEQGTGRRRPVRRMLRRVVERAHAK